MTVDRLENPFLHQDASIVDAIVHRVKEQDVSTVMINGNIVVKEGQISNVDRSALFREIKSALNLPLTEQQLEHRELAQSVMPYLKKFYLGSYDQNFDPFSKYNSI